MSKPWIHSLSSANKFGGKPEDYQEIHELMDSSKGTVPDNRHRCLSHTSWFISTILPRVFGYTFKNSDGKVVSTRDIGEQHVLEDFKMKFIPTVQDYLENMDLKLWMNNGLGGDVPSSYKRIAEKELPPLKLNLGGKPKELID